MRSCRYLVGERFGQLVVERFAGRASNRIYWYAKCDYGYLKRVDGSMLTCGHTLSCGCLQRRHTAEANKRRAKHGMWGTRLYSIWHGMVQRCHYPGHSRFSDYGGRGIEVCPQWRDFRGFLRWALTHGYADGLTIDRIDNSCGYYPRNCRWATRSEQELNKWRNSVKSRAA